MVYDINWINIQSTHYDYYLSYVAVAYDHLCLYALAKPSDIINDGHCGHHLGKHGGVTYGHGRPLFLAFGGWLLVVSLWRSKKEASVLVEGNKKIKCELTFYNQKCWHLLL